MTTRVKLPPRYAPLATAAGYAGVSVLTLRRLLADRTLTRYRVGRSVRVDLNELDAYMRRAGAA